MKNNSYYVNEQVVRVIAAQVVLLVLVALQTQWLFIMLFLALDFGLRAFTNIVSPLAFVAKKIVNLLALKPSYIFAGPKKFAAALGTVFSIGILFLLLAELNFYAWAVGLTLIVCALLEAAFKICIGCYVYNWFVLPFEKNINKLIKSNSEE